MPPEVSDEVLVYELACMVAAVHNYATLDTHVRLAVLDADRQVRRQLTQLLGREPTNGEVHRVLDSTD